MGHLVGIAQLLYGCGTVAAADDGDGIGLAERLGHRFGACGKGREFKDAHGAVPDDGAGAGHGITVQLHGFGTDVQPLPAGGNLPGLYHPAVGVGGIGVGNDGVHRQQQLHTLRPGFFHHFQCVGFPVGFQQAVSYLTALSGGEGVGHAAADNHGVGDFQQVVDDTDFGGNLAASQNGHQRPLGIGQRTADDLQFLFNQEAGHGRQIGGHAGGGGMGAVDGTEGVRHENLRHGGQLLGECRVIFRLTLFKAGVFQQEHLAGLQSGGFGGGILPHYVMGKENLLPQQLAQPLRHRGKGQLFQGLLPGLPGQFFGSLALFRLLLYPLVIIRLRFAQMGAGNHRRPLLQQIADGGQCRHNPLVAGDFTGFLVLRHVEVAAQQNLLSFYVDIPDGFLLIIHKQTPQI